MDLHSDEMHVQYSITLHFFSSSAPHCKGIRSPNIPWMRRRKKAIFPSCKRWPQITRKWRSSLRSRRRDGSQLRHIKCGEIARRFSRREKEEGTGRGDSACRHPAPGVMLWHRSKVTYRARLFQRNARNVRYETHRVAKRRTYCSKRVETVVEKGTYNFIQRYT